MQHRIHLTGGSGSGTTTLGKALALALGCPHLDSDDAYWLPTDPPYGQVRPLRARQAMLEAWLAGSPCWALSGSLVGWGDRFAPQFTAVVFITLPRQVRMDRLRRRERQRYGAAIEPGGPMHPAHETFLRWAEAYDDGGFEIRSRRLHEHWLAGLDCPVLRIDGLWPTERQAAAVLEELGRHASAA
jgi:adenylate kinase family enzyme